MLVVIAERMWSHPQQEYTRIVQFLGMRYTDAYRYIQIQDSAGSVSYA
jgi:hypothetical protein